MVKRPTTECFLFKGAFILMYYNKGHFSQISGKAHLGVFLRISSWYMLSIK